MGRLNVLVGPNGSGKSNFLEAISLFQAAPRDIGEPISRMGGIREWLWKGSDAPPSMTLEAIVDFSLGGLPRHLLDGGLLRHSLTLTEQPGLLIGSPVVADEQIEPTQAQLLESAGLSYYRPPQDERVAVKMISINTRAQLESEKLLVNRRPGVVEFAGEFQPDQSLLSHATFPDYWALWYLNQQYTRIRLYRNWSFGPSAICDNPATHMPVAIFWMKVLRTYHSCYLNYLDSRRGDS